MKYSNVKMFCFMSCVTSISENEMNIQIPLCNVRHVNGMSRNLSQKDALTEKKKIQNTWETIFILEVLNAVM